MGEFQWIQQWPTPPQNGNIRLYTVNHINTYFVLYQAETRNYQIYCQILIFLQSIWCRVMIKFCNLKFSSIRCRNLKCTLITEKNYDKLAFVEYRIK